MLQYFAYSYPGRNRVFGGAAHMDTVNYLYHELQTTGYYDVYKQPQVHLWSKADQNLTVNADKVDASAMIYSPSADVAADLALVSNLGCAADDYPAMAAAHIALIERGDFRLKRNRSWLRLPVLRPRLCTTMSPDR